MADWFSRQFGFRELDFSSTKSKFTLEGSVLTSRDRRDRPFEAGSFETPSLEELRSRVDGRKDLGVLKGHLKVQEIRGEVSDMHVAPENDFAFFQAASQFNCLEHTSSRGTAEDGITCYSHDNTQGPACATACAPGTVMRNYFALGGRGQSAGVQVENLQDVQEVLQNDEHKYISVLNGYTNSTKANLTELGQALKSDPSLQDDVKNKLRIGIQAETEVVCSRLGARPYNGERRLVTQAYCSAISVSYSGCSAVSWAPFATLVLLASFEATLYAAVENALRHPDQPGARRVFLTALGGGVFGNPMGWVEAAMDAAFKKFKDYGLQVFLVSAARSQPEFKALEKRYRGQ